MVAPAAGTTDYHSNHSMASCGGGFSQEEQGLILTNVNTAHWQHLDQVFTCCRWFTCVCGMSTLNSSIQPLRKHPNIFYINKQTISLQKITMETELTQTAQMNREEEKTFYYQRLKCALFGFCKIRIDAYSRHGCWKGHVFIFSMSDLDDTWISLSRLFCSNVINFIKLKTNFSFNHQSGNFTLNR